MPRSQKISAFLLFFACAQALGALQGESVFIKAFLGGVYSDVYETGGDIKMSFSGPGALGILQVGGSLTPAAKVFAFTAGFYTPSVQAKTENLKIATEYGFRTMHDFGIGFAYYLRDGLSVSVGLSMSQSYYSLKAYEKDGSTYTKEGWGSTFILGKDFPLTGKMSFGVSAIGYYGQNRDGGAYDGVPIRNIYGGVAVSLMYD